MKAVRNKDKSSLGLALDHVYIASHGSASFAPYCLFAPGWLIGYDGITGAGFKVAESLPLAPHTETFRMAVHRAGTPMSLTVLPSGAVVVKGAQTRFEIATMAPDAMPNCQPDAALVACNDKLTAALSAAAAVTSPSMRVLASAVLLRDNSCVASNGATILEAWHGLNFSGVKLLLPREFIECMNKVKYTPTHVGWSAGTFTVWYGPSCWLRSNVYGDVDYPDTDVLFAQHRSAIGEFRPVPENTLLALETLKPFLEPYFAVRLCPQGFNTKPDLTGASYAFEHHMLRDGMVPYDGMRYAAMHAKVIGFSDKCLFWQGQTVRGMSVL